MFSFIVPSLLKQLDVYSELHFHSQVRSRPVLDVLWIFTKTRSGTYLVLLETLERFLCQSWFRALITIEVDVALLSGGQNETCILSNCQWVKTPLVPIPSSIVCKLMKK